MTGKCVPVTPRDGLVQISDDNKTIDTRNYRRPFTSLQVNGCLLLTEAKKMNGIKRGEIYYAESSPVIGSEQGGNRHTIILQNDKGNLHSRTTIIAAITSELDKARMPTHVIFTVNGMKKKSMVLLEQIRTIDKSRLGNYVGSVDNKTMKQIDHAIAVSFGLKYWEELKNG